MSSPVGFPISLERNEELEISTSSLNNKPASEREETLVSMEFYPNYLITMTTYIDHRDT
jgi:hypothetical protein